MNVTRHEPDDQLTPPPAAPAAGAGPDPSDRTALGRANSARIRATQTIQRTGLLLAFAVLVIFAATTSASFTDWTNIRIVLLQSSVIGLVAVPLTLLMLAGHIDLSIGAVSALAAVVAGHFWHSEGAAVALLIALAVTLAVGLTNGVLSTFAGFSPIIVTLGAMTALRGVANQISGGLPETTFGPGFANLGQGSVLGIPSPALYAAGAFVIGAVFLYQTSGGRHVRALGVSPESSFLAGIDVNRLPLILYVVTALAAGFGGLVQMSRLDSVAPTLGLGFEIDVLTAVLLGGVAFGGGGGSLLGVLVGVLFLGVLNNTLILHGVSPFWFQISSGVALVLAAGLNRLSGGLATSRRSRGRGRGPSIKLGAER
jgi:ribose transport system permease protein